MAGTRLCSQERARQLRRCPGADAGSGSGSGHAIEKDFLRAQRDASASCRDSKYRGGEGAGGVDVDDDDGGAFHVLPIRATR